MKLNELVEKGYGNCEVKDGIMNFIVMPKKGKVYSVDELEEGEEIFLTNSFGKVVGFVYRNDNFIKEWIMQGNVFYDVESAQEEIKRREVYHKVEKYSYKFSKGEWKDSDIEKWDVLYNYNSRRIDFVRRGPFQCQRITFKFKEDIQKAINEVGEEDFIKYFLGVEL